MKPLFIQVNNDKKEPFYLQVYNFIKSEITNGEISAEEKLPSLRNLARSSGLSLTTIEQAYSQLAVEGYITSRAQSGYYVNKLDFAAISSDTASNTPQKNAMLVFDDTANGQHPSYYHDPECFDFNKWKKCMNKIINDYPETLFFESNPQGEIGLRTEIAKYLYVSRGVSCTPDQIIIGAGTQQITNHIATILRKLKVEHVAMENPGYKPVRSIFRDRGFAITDVSVSDDGIAIEKLPMNIKTAAYASPSNHIFTGAVMPVGRRYQLLGWAVSNDSYIIEDDYDSELRYFGRPIPALKSLDTHDRVIYLGSFSSTLFAAIKISYMVLPEHMAKIYRNLAPEYSQTCSKLDQLSLAMFMETGNYHTHLKKLRKLYSRKQKTVTDFFSHNAPDVVELRSSTSGLNQLIRIISEKTCEEIKKDALNLGIPLVSLQGSDLYLLYYNQIPQSEIVSALSALVCALRKPV